MRVIVFFDLPVTTKPAQREYRRFRKFLVKSGFVMVQESVYSKIALNTSTAEAIKRSVKKEKPINGLVQLLIITEKQYNSIEYIVGKSSSEVLTSDERLVIL